MPNAHARSRICPGSSSVWSPLNCRSKPSRRTEPPRAHEHPWATYIMCIYIYHNDLCHVYHNISQWTLIFLNSAMICHFHPFHSVSAQLEPGPTGQWQLWQPRGVPFFQNLEQNEPTVNNLGFQLWLKHIETMIEFWITWSFDALF